MFQFRQELSEGFFWVPKSLVKEGNFALLPLASKKALPAIARFCDRTGDSFPSESTVAALSGLSLNTVRAGIDGLEHFPGVTISPYITSRGKRSRRFNLGWMAKRGGGCFPFHHAILDGGNWFWIPRPAAALYIAMRAFGFVDYETVMDEAEADNPDDFHEAFRDRQFEFCAADDGVLQQAAGISRRAFFYALKNLQTVGLSEPGEEARKVFIRPNGTYPRKDMNAELLRRFGRRAQCTD